MTDSNETDNEFINNLSQAPKLNRDLLQDLSDVDSDSKLIPLGVYSDSETEEFVYIPKRW